MKKKHVRKGGGTRKEGEPETADTVLKQIEQGRKRLRALQDYILDSYSIQEKLQKAYSDPTLQPSTKNLLTQKSTRLEKDLLRVVQLPTDNATERSNTLLNIFNASFGGTLLASRWLNFFGPASVFPMVLSVLFESSNKILKQVASKADTTEAQWTKHQAGGSYLLKAATDLRGPLTASEKAAFIKADDEIMKQLGVIGANLFAGSKVGELAAATKEVADLGLKYSPGSFATWKEWGAAVLAGAVDRFIANSVDTGLLENATIGPYYTQVRNKIKNNLPYFQTFAWWFGIPAPTIANLDQASIKKFYNGVKSASTVLKILTIWAWNAITMAGSSLNRLVAPIGPAGLHKNLTTSQLQQRDKIQALLQEASGVDLAKDEARRQKWADEIDQLSTDIDQEGSNNNNSKVAQQTKELIPALLTAWHSFFQTTQLQAMFFQRYEEMTKLLENYLGSDSSNYSPLTLSKLAYSLVEDLRLVPVYAISTLSSTVPFFRGLNKLYAVEQGLRYDRPKLLLATGSGSSLALAPGFLLAINRLAIFASAIYGTNLEMIKNTVAGKIAMDTTAQEYAAHAASQSYLSRFRNRLYDWNLGKKGEDPTGSGSFVVAGASNTWEPLLRYEPADQEQEQQTQSTAKLLNFYPQSSVTKLQYGIIYDDVLRALVVTFRGTVSPFDMFLDADLRLRYYEFQRFGSTSKIRGYVHNSFYEAAKQLNMEVYDWLNRREKTRQKVKCLVYTGHSLGAAVACLSTLIAHNALEEFNLRRIGKADNRLQQIFGVGFATPACMTPNLGKVICGLFQSIVYSFDIIPRFNPYSLYRYGLSKNVLLPCSYRAGDCDRNDFLSDPVADCQVFMPIIPGGSILYGCWQLKNPATVAQVNTSNVQDFISPFFASVHPAWLIDRLEPGPTSLSDHSMFNYLHFLRTFYFGTDDSNQHIALTIDSARQCLKTWKTAFLACPAYPDIATDPDLQGLITEEDRKCLASMYDMDFAPDRAEDVVTPLAPTGTLTNAKAEFFTPVKACNNGPKNTETVCEAFFSDEEQLEKIFANGSMIQALASTYQRKLVAQLMVLGQSQLPNDDATTTEGVGGRLMQKERQVEELKRRAFLAQSILDAYHQAYGPTLPSAPPLQNNNNNKTV